VRVNGKDGKSSYIGDKMKKIITFSTKADGDLMKRISVWLKVRNYCIRALINPVINF
jgi:hypothetical protein